MSKPGRQGFIMQYRMAYKFRLYPTQEQIHQINHNFGCVRFVYNHFLHERKLAWQKTQKEIKQPKIDNEGNFVRDDAGKIIYEIVPNEIYDPNAKPMTFADTSRALTQLKKEVVDEQGHQWLKDADSTALVYAIRNLDNAYKNFFNGLKKGLDVGYPRFKKRSNDVQSYKTQNIKVLDNAVVLPKIGKVKAKIHRPVEGRVVNGTISRNAANHYFISINVEGVHKQVLTKTNQEVGLTYGISHWIVTSDGEVIDRPGKNTDVDRIAVLEKRLKHQQRILSRKKLGSSNWKKQNLKVNRIHERIANIRNNSIHELTHDLVKNYDLIASREMSTKEMMQHENTATKNLPKLVQRHMNKEMVNNSFYEINRQLEYKAMWGGKTFVKVANDIPTAQVCNRCGHRFEVLAKDLRPIWRCPECGAENDRKYNGALNVLDAAKDILASEEKSAVLKERKKTQEKRAKKAKAK